MFGGQPMACSASTVATALPCIQRRASPARSLRATSGSRSACSATQKDQLMRSFLPFIIIGLTTGGVYALASLGLVLTYRTSGVFNFGHGAIGMAATYAFYSLRQHIPTAPAVILAIFVVAPLLGVAIDRLLLRRLSGAAPASYVVASLGLLVALQGAASAIYGAE